MAPLCYLRHRFPPEIIQHAIWLYLRFTLSYRDVEELLAERGLDISYETVRRWVLRSDPIRNEHSCFPLDRPRAFVQRSILAVGRRDRRDARRIINRSGPSRD